MKSLKNKKKNKYRNIFIIGFILFILLSISLTLKKTNYRYKTLLKDVLLSINFPYSYLYKDKDYNYSNNFTNNKIISMEKDIEELKNLLNLNKTQSNYKIENATVLSKNKSYYLNDLIIDKGSINGIKKDMAVINDKGLIGKVTLVTKHFSEVKLLTANDIKYKISISIKVNNQDNYAILNGYDYDKKLLKVSGVNKMIDIKKGDVVVTSSIGDLFPSGIYIGKVQKVINDKYDLSKSLLIKPDNDFNSIHYVSVLKEII